MHGRRVDGADRFDLRRGQAVGAVAVLAEQHRRIERAVRGVFDDAVFDAVLGVAGIERGLMDDG